MNLDRASTALYGPQPSGRLAARRHLHVAGEIVQGAQMFRLTRPGHPSLRGMNTAVGVFPGNGAWHVVCNRG